MAWRVELDPAAEHERGKIDQRIARRILAFLHDRVAQLDEPRSLGVTPKGSKLGTFWKYRVGDPRIVASIEDGALRILVVRIGNRREVYQKSSGMIPGSWAMNPDGARFGGADLCLILLG